MRGFRKRGAGSRSKAAWRRVQRKFGVCSGAMRACGVCAADRVGGEGLLRRGLQGAPGGLARSN